MTALKPPRLLALLALIDPKTLDHIRWWANLYEYDSVGDALTVILSLGLSDHFDEEEADDFDYEDDVLVRADAFADREGMTLREAVRDLLWDGLEGL